MSSSVPHQEQWIGCIGTDARIEGNDLLNTVIVWKKSAVDEIHQADQNINDGKKDLSCGYASKLVPEEGIFEGKQYHFRMVDLKGNHVALVASGRVEWHRRSVSFPDLYQHLLGLIRTVRVLHHHFL